ncbi:MAG: DNA primase small subunit domain-containing protein [Candidatus Gagatemarchaeaceae archaeon]
MNDATKNFLKSAYKEFYFRRADAIEFPDEIQSREFGYIPFGGGMVRHLSFRNEGEAVAEVLKQSPSSVYCSNAKYESPTVPIEQKGWLGAELIFDIDATDIPTPCKKAHDIWYCDKCHVSGRLPRPQKCPKCGGTTSQFHGTCEVCLGAAKEHALRVVGFLTGDFGVEREAIRLYFSGNRGYHLHVFDPRFNPLDQLGRGEIADYMRGASLPLSQTIASTLRRKPAGAGAQGEGWTRRITGYVEEKRQGYGGTLQKLVSEAVSSQRALVDTSVTTDIHRVFRLAGTLHGNTGMCKTRIESIESFDPQTDPVVLSPKPVKMNVDFYPAFIMKGAKFGPFKSESAELPTFAAIPILTRGLGEVT